jgi:hypothetical protein
MAMHGRKDDCIQLLEEMTLLKPHSDEELDVCCSEASAEENASGKSLNGGIAAALSF